MFEMLLTFANPIGSIFGKQTYLATNQVGQIKYSNAYGHCLNWDGSKFYQVMGISTRSGSLVPNLFVYDVDTNIWKDLGAIPAALNTNSYWAMYAIDDDRILATCRMDRGIYTESTGTWEVLAKGPTGDSNMYGSKMHKYKDRIYNIGDAASGSAMSVGIFNPTDKTTINGGNSGLRLGTYSCTVRCNGKIYGFPGIAVAHQRVQIYDIATGAFSSSASGPPFNLTFTAGYAYGDKIYLFGGSGDSTGWSTVWIYDTLTDSYSSGPVMNRKNMQPQGFMNRGKMMLWGGNETGTNPVYDNFLTYDLGIDIPQFGPGPRDIAYGDVKQGFYGEIPAGKFMGIGSLRNWSRVTEGSNDNTWDGKWFKMSIEGKVVYVPSAQVATGITFQNLASRGVADGKEIYFRGNTYKMRLVNMASGDVWPVASNFTDFTTSENVMNSEWGKIVGGLIEANGFTVGRKWNLYPTARTLSPTNKWIHARQLRSSNPANSIVLDNSRFSFNDINTPSTIGWYPVLELVGPTAEPPSVDITGTYYRRADGPTKYAFTSQYIDGKVYSFSGYFASGNMSNDMNVYDPNTDKWSVITGVNQPQGRYGYGCCVYDGKYWIFGGRTTTTPLDDIHCYDPVTSTWTAMGNLPSARYYPTAAVVGNKIYVQCGYTGTVQLQSNWIYDPVTKTGTDGLQCPTGMHGHNAVVYKDKIYLVGGIQGGTTRTTLIYNPESNSWVGGGNLPVASSYGATVLRGDKMYRYGGGDSSAGAPQASLLVYNFTTDTWSSTNTGPTARSLLSMVSLPEGLWFYGGLNSVSLAESYLIT